MVSGEMSAEWPLETAREFEGGESLLTWAASSLVHESHACGIQVGNIDRLVVWRTPTKSVNLRYFPLTERMGIL